MHRILRLVKKRIVLLDGATGTNLLDKGLQPGESPSVLNVRDPGVVERLQRAYVHAGADAILTNTFSANPVTVPGRQLTRIVKSGVHIAQRAARGKASVMGDIGPLGELIRPYGSLRFEEAVRIFKSIARVLANAGIRMFFLETFTSMIEAKAAFLATREFSSGVFVSFSLQDNGYTVMGESPETLALTFSALEASGIGINCTLPDVAVEAIDRMSRVTPLPLIVKPNAGSIRIRGTAIKHSLSDRELARYYVRFVNAGANMVGGCCGTTPEYIEHLKEKPRRAIRKRAEDSFALVSPRRVFRLRDEGPAIIGERMNPSGRKRVKESLLKDDYCIYQEEAQRQERAGADILDVNAYVVDRDETETLVNAVEAVITASALPVFIDTQNLRAAEQALRLYPGIGALNSVPVRSRELRRWLPMIRQYGFKAVISLVGRKVPRTIDERMKNVKRALEIGRKTGFPREDMIFDPLVFSAATDHDQVAVTLETVRLLNRQGLKTILGISNVSFGLPERGRLNAVLISSAIACGATFLIVNPMNQAVQEMLTACRALYRGKVIEYLADAHPGSSGRPKKVSSEDKGKKDDVIAAILRGDPVLSAACAQTMIASGISPQTIIDKYVGKALKQVGDRYESGEVFIPDLLRSADAAHHALRVVREHLPRQKGRGTLILATVKGDIHDIGKNIAAMIFESAGYTVIDLGKDVDAARIVKAAKKHRAKVVGLSALLTTTMPEMGRVIRMLKEHNVPAKVIVGGPNVSDAFARDIGAFGAAPTVMAGLRLLKRIM